MSTTTRRPTPRQRYPFPEKSLPLLAEWHKLAEELHLLYGTESTRSRLDGRKEPSGPQQWRDNGPVAYKAFLAYFLSFNGKPVNHHLSVEFGTGGTVAIVGGNHRGAHIEMSLDTWTPETFAADLRAAARYVGLLPREEGLR